MFKRYLLLMIAYFLPFFPDGLFFPFALLRPLGEGALFASAIKASWAAISSSRFLSASRNFCRKASRGLLMASRAESSAA